MSESGFRKLLDIGDKQIREELQDDYYFISKNRMDNFIYCLESGGQEIVSLRQQLSEAQGDIEHLREENSHNRAAYQFAIDELRSELSDLNADYDLQCQFRDAYRQDAINLQAQLSEAQAENKELAANMTRCLAELSFEASAKCKALDKLHRIQLGFSTDNIADNIQLQLNAAKTDITVLQMQLKEMNANEIWLREENKVLLEEAQGNNLLLVREGQEHRRCIDELKRVAEFAQCMGSPIEYEDDSIYLKSIKRYVKFLETEMDQLRVQLAGCGVAAMCNTRESIAMSAKVGDYGYSASYQNVLDAVVREIDYREQVAELQAKLSRYENGVEVEGTVSLYEYANKYQLYAEFPFMLGKQYIGQRVKVLVMKEEI